MVIDDKFTISLVIQKKLTLAHLEQCQVDHITPRVVGIGDEHCSWVWKT